MRSWNYWVNKLHIEAIKSTLNEDSTLKETQFITPDNQRSMMKLTLLLVSSLTIMSVITISPALPQMAEEFTEVPRAEFLVKLVLTLPALLIAIISPIAGRLIDRYGRLRLLWMALGLYAISGVAGFYLDNLHHILISRGFLGIAVGMSMTIAITLIADYFEGMERQKFVGIQIAFMSIGGILFIGLGGVLADISWRYPFLLYLFALLVLPLSMIYLPEPVLHKSTGGSVIQEKAPSIIWLLFINTLVMWILFFMIPVQIPFHMKAIGIEKNTLTGIAIAISTLFSAISSFYYARIKGKFNYLTIFAVGYLLMAAGYVALSFSEGFALVVVAMILCGLGIGMMIPNTNMWVMKLAPLSIRGREIGKLTTFWFFGQFLSPIIAAPILTVYTLPDTFMAAAIIMLMLFLGFSLLRFSRVQKLAE